LDCNQSATQGIQIQNKMKIIPKWSTTKQSSVQDKSLLDTSFSFQLKLLLFKSKQWFIQKKWSLRWYIRAQFPYKIKTPYQSNVHYCDVQRQNTKRLFGILWNPTRTRTGRRIIYSAFQTYKQPAQSTTKKHNYSHMRMI
jgi:hypothetical protein